MPDETEVTDKKPLTLDTIDILLGCAEACLEAAEDSDEADQIRAALEELTEYRGVEPDPEIEEAETGETAAA